MHVSMQLYVRVYIILYLISSSSAYLEPGAILSDVTHTIKEREAGTEGDHEYELLDKYTQPYEDIEIPKTAPPKSGEQKSSSAGDYEFTHCPAYVPVTHGNQQADISLSQPSTTTGPSTEDKDSAGEYEVVNVSAK